MSAQDLSRSRQSRVIQAHSKCPPPPLTELNHHALDFLDIRDASHLHTLLDSNSSGSTSRYVKRQQQLLETDECATSLPRVIPRGQPRVRSSMANFKAWTGADLERCQRGRLNCKRRAHFAVGRICYLAALKVHTVITYHLTDPRGRSLPVYLTGKALTNHTQVSLCQAGEVGWDTDTWSHRHIFYRYNIIVNKHIDNKSVRYIVLDTLGAGSYGQVFKCQDLDKRDVVAIKVMSWDKHRTSDRAFENEKRILSMLNEGDPQGEHHIIPFREAFMFGNHGCLVFTTGGPSLYMLLKKRLYRGLDIEDVRGYTRQILEALKYMHSKGLTHADLKPENTLTDSVNPKRLWLIDFGLSCRPTSLPFDQYMQTRYYRAPECIIGYKKTWAIDIWSLGCMCAELFLGSPLLATNNEVDQLKLIEAKVGQIPDEIMRWCQRISPRKLAIFYQTDYTGVHFYRRDRDMALERLKQLLGEDNVNVLPRTKLHHGTIEQVITAKARNSNVPTEMCVWLVDFLLRILRVDPRERPAAYEALQHPFITGHLDGRIQDWEPEGTSPQAFPISPGALRQNKHFAIRPPRPPNLNDYNVPKYDNDSLYTMNAAADVLSNAESTRVLNKVRPDGTRLPLPYPESDGPPPVPPSIQLHRTIRRPFQQHSSQTEQRAAPLSERSQGYRPAAGNNTLHYQQVRRRQDAP